jgi:3-oxoacyl-[acyl-carrier protein] reductase
MVQMDIQFLEKTVIVTGAAHGFGRQISLEFARRGARVWACDVLADELAETRQLCVAEGGECETRPVDITHRDQIMSLVAEILQESKQADILVNNAGGVLGQVGCPLEEVTPEDWRAIFDINVSGAFYFAQAVVPGMKRARFGRIINISSGAGLGISLTGIQAYAAAKAALVNLTRQLAHELGPWNITVNSVAPGFVRCNPSTERQWQSYGEAGQRDLLSRIALRRLGTPEDIAYSTLFLASDYAGWITGQIIAVDGGK